MTKLIEEIKEYTVEKTTVATKQNILTLRQMGQQLFGEFYNAVAGVCRILREEIGKGTLVGLIIGVGASLDPLSQEGQVELSHNLQNATAAIDSTGMCLFIPFAVLDDATCLPALIDMINVRFGIALTADDVC